jgi:hypothetical protein
MSQPNYPQLGSTPELTTQSGINGNDNLLFCLILGPVVYGNTTPLPSPVLA